MRVKMMVVQERADKYQGKRGEVHQRILTCQDLESFQGQLLLNTVDYILTPEEELAIPAHSLDGKQVELGVREITAGFGGRFRFRGAVQRPEQKPVETGKKA